MKQSVVVEMPAEPSRAVVVDVQDEVTSFINLIKQITSEADDNFKHVLDTTGNDVPKTTCVYFLTRNEVALPSDIPKSTIVAQSDRIRSFYEAKRRFDNEGTVEVVIVCYTPYEEYWKAVCGTLLTPVHAWHIETVPNDTVSAIDASSVVKNVKEMLTKLPSIGELTVNTSPLVPRNIFNHGYTTRKGGITTIPTLSSLNLLYTPKKRDSSWTVAENLRRLAAAAKFDPENFFITRTEHGNNVWVIGEERPEKYDSMVTNKPGITLAAAGADCTPLLFMDPVKRICGAAHAGYRGTLMKVAVKTVEAMVKTYDSKIEDILVTMGPTVGPGCFSFPADDPAVGEFQAVDPSLTKVKQDGDKVRVTTDIVTCNKMHLERAGILTKNIDIRHASCTSCDPDRFYSYERDGFPFGNQIGFVSITP